MVKTEYKNCITYLDEIIPDFDRSLHDVNIYSSYVIDYSFLSPFQKFLRKSTCFLGGHNLKTPLYNNPYCSNCMKEFKKPDPGSL